MHAHKTRVLVTETHAVVIELPRDFPVGDAEVTVVATRAAAPATVDGASPQGFRRWLADLNARLPPAPVVPLASLSREHLYDD